MISQQILYRYIDLLILIWRLVLLTVGQDSRHTIRRSACCISINLYKYIYVLK